MNYFQSQHAELIELLEALCEDRLTKTEAARMEELVLNSDSARRLYVEYLDLHGTLHWDTAGSIGPAGDASLKQDDLELLPEFALRGLDLTEFLTQPVPAISAVDSTENDSRWNVRSVAAVMTAACVLAGVLLWMTAKQTDNPQLAQKTPEQNDSQLADTLSGNKTLPVIPSPLELPPPPEERLTERPGERIELGHITPDKPDPKTPIIVENTPKQKRPETLVAPEQIAPQQHVAGSSADIIAMIDTQLQSAWLASGVTPSPVATDEEWIRRVSLDFLGHTPSADVVTSFVKNRSSQKRADYIDTLLDDPDYVRNMTTVWSNLLIGRSESEEINRDALRKYLRTAFAENRPWSQMVHELVSAEGTADDHGAANFMLAHLNNDAVPATAVTAKVFLGTQIQCTQCHDHPFNDWKQNQFWEFNSFFQQTDIEHVQKKDERTGKREKVAQLVSDQTISGPIFYETRQGLMRVAYPKFAGKQVKPGPGINRRQELADLMVNQDTLQLARAMVNRTWAHFFGHGFTSPIDDMGPHNPPSHPLLLEMLAQNFVHSGFDQKQLIRWITNSKAYQLTSQMEAGNTLDNPEIGEIPLFSRVYVKLMTAEQLYDSLVVATNVNRDADNWKSWEADRQSWLQQFIHDYNTEENDEHSLFDGTVPQALMMMNGSLMQDALALEPGTYLHLVATSNKRIEAKVDALALATLSRSATPQEKNVVKQMLKQRLAQTKIRTPQTALKAQAETLQDIFWAYLNSSEFIIVH